MIRRRRLHWYEIRQRNAVPIGEVTTDDVRPETFDPISAIPVHEMITGNAHLDHIGHPGINQIGSRDIVRVGPSRHLR